MHIIDPARESVASSLYDLLSKPVGRTEPEPERPRPDTIVTASIETIDNDRVSYLAGCGVLR
jgi:hypothetical protein